MQNKDTIVNKSKSQSGRLSPAYFPLSHFKKMKAFSSKYSVSSSYFPIFQTKKNFWFFAKNLKIRAENIFLGKNTIWYTFYSKFATFSDFEKIVISSKKPIYFSWKTRILFVLRNFITSVTFYGKGIVIEDEKFSNSETDTSMKSHIINWQKEEKNGRVECMIFLPYYEKCEKE